MRSFSLAPFALVILLVASALPTSADEVRVAVASNFSQIAKVLFGQFERESGHEVVAAFGSTGKQYAQIVQGAPFDVFLAADRQRPQKLEENGLVISGSRFTYALGRVVLWSPQPDYVDEHGSILERGQYRHLAVANPRLAPYGKAARQVLEKRGLWQNLQSRIVRGENIGQTFQFVATGNAELGFVALSQISHADRPLEGSFWVVPLDAYDRIEQQAVLLRDKSSARSFLSYLASESARRHIEAAGYGLPERSGP